MSILTRARPTVTRAHTAPAPRYRDRALAAGLRLLGPGWVKVGQLASTRRDLLPESICAELERALARGRESYRRGTATVSGSVATVSHQPGPGAGWAVKRLTARADRRLRANLSAIRWGASLLGRLPQARGVPVAGLAAELTAAVATQTDLRREAEHLGQLARALRRHPVDLPVVDRERTNAEELWMSWIPRDPALDIELYGVAERERLMTVLLESLFEMIFHRGLFHCDLHPGNWWPTGPDRIAIVDAGFLYEMSDEARWHFVEFFWGMATGDGEHSVEHMLATSDTALEPAVEARLRGAVTALVEEAHGISVAEFGLATFGRRLFEIQRDHGFYGDHLVRVRARSTAVRGGPAQAVGARPGLPGGGPSQRPERPAAAADAVRRAPPELAAEPRCHQFVK